MIIEITEKEINKKDRRSITQFKIDGQTFYRAGPTLHIEENFSDYAEYLIYCLRTIAEDGILGNCKPELMSPLEFEEKENRPDNEELLKQMLENARREIEVREDLKNDLGE